MTQALMRDIAREERDQLGLGTWDPLDPRMLAEAHGIRVYPLSELCEHGASLEALAHWAEPVTKWSAALVPFGTARVILENDSHAEERRRSNIAHELGHHLLEHAFEDAIVGEDHERQFDKTQEKQATFISGELLIPHEAAKHMAYNGWNNMRAAAAFGVSEQFAQMQLYGLRVAAKNAAAKRARRT